MKKKETIILKQKMKKSNNLNKKIAFGVFATILIALGLGFGLGFGLKKPAPEVKKVVDEATKTELTEAQTALAEAEEAAQAAEASQIKLKKGLQKLNNILRSETLKNQKQKKALQDTFKQQLEKTVTKAEEAAVAEQHELKTDVDELTKHLSDAVAEKKQLKQQQKKLSIELKQAIDRAKKAERTTVEKQIELTEAKAEVKSATDKVAEAEKIAEIKQAEAEARAQAAETTAAEVATSKKYLSYLQKLAINSTDKNWIIENLKNKIDKKHYISWHQPYLDKPNTTEKEKTDAYIQFLVWQFIKWKLGKSTFDDIRKDENYKKYFFSIIHPIIEAQQEKINLEAVAVEKQKELAKTVAEVAEQTERAEAAEAELNKLKPTSTD